MIQKITHFFLFGLGFFLVNLAPTYAQFRWLDTCDSLRYWSQNGDVWEARSDGAAPRSSYWGARQRIASNSWGGAFSYDADSTVYEPVRYFRDTLQSTFIPLTNFLPNNPTVYIKFNEYFRKSRNNKTSLNYRFVTNSGTTRWDTLNLHTNIPINYETANNAFFIQKVNVPIGASFIQLRFLFEGNFYFWIIDDIEISQEFPAITRPNPQLGEYLYLNNYPFNLDSVGHPYIPNSLIVSFDPTASDSLKAVQRALHNVSDYKTCGCKNGLETWAISLPPVSTSNPTAAIFTTSIEDKVKGTSSTTKIRSSEPNFYTYDLLENRESQITNAATLIRTPPDSLNKALPNDVIKIAVLDTGIDYNLPYFRKRILQNKKEDDDNFDNDLNCFTNDFIGYNLANKTNNPIDNNSHGSHVTGIITRTFDRYYNEGTPFSCHDIGILPIKTHDKNGIGNLFTGLCGLYYAVEQGAKVINCSWGYYDTDGEGKLFQQFLNDTRNSEFIVVASAGNDGLTIEYPNFHYPASVSSPKFLGVAAMDSSYSKLWTFSNRGVNQNLVGARGENVYSNILQQQRSTKSGTSMAAPVVSALLANEFCHSDQSADVLSAFYSRCYQRENSALAIGTHHYVTPYRCPSAKVPTKGLAVYPNPTSGYLYLENSKLIELNKITIYDAIGQFVFEQTANEKSFFTKIPTDLMPSGMYIISVSDKSGENWIFKVIKTTD